MEFIVSENLYYFLELVFPEFKSGVGFLNTTGRVRLDFQTDLDKHLSPYPPASEASRGVS